MSSGKQGTNVYAVMRPTKATGECAPVVDSFC